ncbi:MAG: hypothetical protein HY900_21855 [Deltaproteobacteria bacterium]|nr:hypothetical protein [Deltaproteobacteria bacterium]
MANRTGRAQSTHDGVIAAAGEIYRRANKAVWLNPGSEKNKPWSGQYIDIIVAANRNRHDAVWVIEVETDDSVSELEAKDEWTGYATAFSNWCLAVQEGSEEKARALLDELQISNCAVITWQNTADGKYAFSGLPGLT